MLCVRAWLKSWFGLPHHSWALSADEQVLCLVESLTRWLCRHRMA